MEITTVTPQFSVSSQVLPEQLEQLAALNIDVLISNRPDGEEELQPNFADIENAAKQAGIEAVYLPMQNPEDIPSAHVSAFKTIIESGRRVHAYCRTGNRSNHLWKASV